jgi:hypothetical protein
MAGMKTFGTIVTGVVANTPEPSRSVLDIALAEFDRVSHLRLTATAIGATVSQSSPCATSGTIALSGTVVDPNATHPMAGDKVTLTFNNCVANGSTLTGSTSFAINTFSGGVTDIAGNVVGTVASPLNTSFIMSFGNLSSLNNATNQKSSMNGDIAMVTQSNGDTTTGMISGASFSVVGTGPTVGGFAMTNYALAFSRTISTGASSNGTTMTTASTFANGSVNIFTPTVFSCPNFGIQQPA